MYGPFVALYRIFYFFPGFNIYTRHKESLAVWLLQIEPYLFSVGGEPFMSRYFHVHSALMHQLYLLCIDVDGPDAVYLVPGAFMAKHQQPRISCRKLNVVEPRTVGKYLIE